MTLKCNSKNKSHILWMFCACDEKLKCASFIKQETRYKWTMDTFVKCRVTIDSQRVTKETKTVYDVQGPSLETIDFWLLAIHIFVMWSWLLDFNVLQHTVCNYHVSCVKYAIAEFIANNDIYWLCQSIVWLILRPIHLMRIWVGEWPYWAENPLRGNVQNKI